jgi:hypothetical protein
MKRILLALSAVAALMVAGAASAQDIHIGPGGVRVGPRHYYDYRGGGCRTIIDHHTGPNGNSVTVRRRVCD